jgi:hypothetical protein
VRKKDLRLHAEQYFRSSSLLTGSSSHIFLLSAAIVEWKVEGGRWKVEGGRWKVEGGRWKVEGGRWKERNLIQIPMVAER